MQGLVPFKALCLDYMSIHPYQMSCSSENDSYHRSGGESDCEGSAASSHESELSDTRKRRTRRRNERRRNERTRVATACIEDVEFVPPSTNLKILFVVFGVNCAVSVYLLSIIVYYLSY
jgi:hypothetical protein